MKASFSALRVPALAKAAQRAAFSAFFSAAPEAAALGAAGGRFSDNSSKRFRLWLCRLVVFHRFCRFGFSLGFGLSLGLLPLFLVSLEFSAVTLEYGRLISLCPGHGPG